MSSEITVTEHLLLQQQRAPQATGHFTALFHDLVLSAKIIARSVNKAGLLDVLGGTGDINVQGENVQKLDDFANRVLLYRMERSGVLCAIASEENAELVRVSAAFPRGDYMLTLQCPDTALLYTAAQKLEKVLMAEPLLSGVNSDLLLADPQVHLDIDREKAARLGIPVRSIEDATRKIFCPIHNTSRRRMNGSRALVDPGRKVMRVERPARSAVAING